MKHTYLLNVPGLKNIPNHASTHYVRDLYPVKPMVPKTVKGAAPKPAIQRKTSKKDQPIIASIQVIDSAKSTFNIKMPRFTFRKNIDKAALAKYFDNDVIPSREEIAQEKLDAWLTQAAIDLENADIAKAEQDYKEKDEIRDFVENVWLARDLKEQDKIRTLVEAAKCNKPSEPQNHEHYTDGTIWDEYDEFAEELLQEEIYDAHYELEYVGINSIDKTEEDKFERLFFENEINAHKVDMFEKKMARSNQMHGMMRLHFGQFRRDKRKQIYKDFLSRQR